MLYQYTAMERQTTGHQTDQCPTTTLTDSAMHSPQKIGSKRHALSKTRACQVQRANKRMWDGYHGSSGWLDHHCVRSKTPPKVSGSISLVLSLSSLYGWDGTESFIPGQCQFITSKAREGKEINTSHFSGSWTVRCPACPIKAQIENVKIPAFAYQP